MRRLALTALAFVLVGGAAAGVSLINPVPRAAAPSVELPRTTQLTCVPAGQALVAGDGAVAASPLGEELGEASPSLREVTTEGPTVLRADGLAVGGVLVTGSQRTYAPCSSPSPSGMLLIDDPATTELVLVNSDASEAAVDLTLLGPDGELEPVGARGIAIAPGVERRIALSVLAPEGPVAVAYTATQGRVATLAVAVEGRPTRFTPATQAATEHVIAGIGADAADPRLVLSNPTENRVEVSVEALGETTSYEPATASGLSVPPMSTLAVELGSALGGEPSALRVTSDEAIGAAVVVTGAGPAATLVQGEPGTDLGVNAPGGVLQVSNPGSEVATVRLTSPASAEETEFSVAPGTTLATPLPGAEPQQVRVVSSEELVGAVVSPDASGVVVAPLGSLSEPEGAPGVISLDPTLR